MNRRSFAKTLLGTVLAVTTAARMTLQPESCSLKFESRLDEVVAMLQEEVGRVWLQRMQAEYAHLAASGFHYKPNELVHITIEQQ